MIRIAINGFGRIGRLVLRSIEERRQKGENIQVIAINGTTEDTSYYAYQFKYDSVFGKYPFNVSYKNNVLMVNNEPIFCLCEKDPTHINWNKFNIDCVFECTGIFTTIEKANIHIKNGAKKVIISAPSKDAPMYVMGVNHKEYSNEPIISNASCTTNCLAPIVKLLHQHYEIEEGLMTTIHSTTASQKTVDGSSSKNWRIGRSSSTNIIPSSTGAAQAVTEIIPELKGKITGMAFRVPTINVSVVDFTVRFKKSVDFNDIVNTIKESSISDMSGIIGWTDEQLVSSDFIGDSRSCVFDISSCIALNNNFMKLIAWYDNEWGYSNRLVDLMLHVFKKY